MKHIGTVLLIALLLAALAMIPVQAAEQFVCTCAGVRCLPGSFDDRCPVCAANPSSCRARAIAAKAAANTFDVSIGDVVIPKTLKSATVTGSSDNQYTVTVEDGFRGTITLNNLNIYSFNKSPVAIGANARTTVRLVGKTILTSRSDANPALGLGSAASVTLQGKGTLLAYASDETAVIGSKPNETCGDITVAGGIIYAKKTARAMTGAAIGGSAGGGCGNLTIKGGTVIAAGASDAACIGAGGNGGLCGNITITGGAVTTVNGCVGMGAKGTGGSSGNITIKRGTVTVDGAGGVGIGTEGMHCDCGAITIAGGSVRIKAANSATAGIGVSDSTSHCENIAVTGGFVEITGAFFDINSNDAVTLTKARLVCDSIQANTLTLNGASTMTLTNRNTPYVIKADSALQGTGTLTFAPGNADMQKNLDGLGIVQSANLARTDAKRFKLSAAFDEREFVYNETEHSLQLAALTDANAVWLTLFGKRQPAMSFEGALQAISTSKKKITKPTQAVITLRRDVGLSPAECTMPAFPCTIQGGALYTLRGAALRMKAAAVLRDISLEIANLYADDAALQLEKAVTFNTMQTVSAPNCTFNKATVRLAGASATLKISDKWTLNGANTLHAEGTSRLILDGCAAAGKGTLTIRDDRQSRRLGDSLIVQTYSDIGALLKRIKLDGSTLANWTLVRNGGNYIFAGKADFKAKLTIGKKNLLYNNIENAVAYADAKNMSAKITLLGDAAGSLGSDSVSWSVPLTVDGGKARYFIRGDVRTYTAHNALTVQNVRIPGNLVFDAPEKPLTIANADLGQLTVASTPGGSVTLKGEVTVRDRVDIAGTKSLTFQGVKLDTEIFQYGDQTLDGILTVKGASSVAFKRTDSIPFKAKSLVITSGSSLTLSVENADSIRLGGGEFLFETTEPIAPATFARIKLAPDMTEYSLKCYDSTHIMIVRHGIDDSGGD